MTEMVAPSLRSSLYSLLPYVRIRVLASLRFSTVGNSDVAFCTSDLVDMSLERGLLFAHLHA